MALLQDVIPAYLYRQYQNDDDLAALTEAYNAAAQYYLDWFQSINLAYYPGLSADLLDWVADGVYGMQRTSLASPITTALGPLNTVTLNADYPLNAYTPSSETFYSLTDDAFQRIITWNFYKGDGKRFSMRWLKRRIMRFLLGANGTDPQGGVNATVGTENTQAISVTVASNVITVSINQVLLSQIAQLTPGILQIFQLAFEAGQPGPLELPLQYESYVCNIVTSLTASAVPNSLGKSGTATTQTTSISDVVVLGGSGSYTYAWSWLSGGSGISINPLGSPTGSSVDFTASGMTPGDTYSGVAKCLITDTVTSDTTTCQISVSITCYAALSASISPTSVSVTGATSSLSTGNVTANISGGSGSYSVSWGFSSGGTGIGINAPSSVTTDFTGTGLSPGGSESGTAQCTVTDTVTGNQVFPTCAVSINRVTGVSLGVSPSSATSSGTATTQTTNAVTASASGGSGSYAIAYSWYSGGAGLGINSPSSATTTVTGAGMTPGNTYTGTMKCIATDGYGQQSAPVYISVSISCTNPNYNGTMVAGQGGDWIGYYPAGSTGGSMTPSTDPAGSTITALADNAITGVLFLQITGVSSPPPRTYFTTLYINGTPYTPAGATSYGVISGNTVQWVWGGNYGFVDGDSYSITIDE